MDQFLCDHSIFPRVHHLLLLVTVLPTVLYYMYYEPLLYNIDITIYEVLGTLLVLLLVYHT